MFLTSYIHIMRWVVSPQAHQSPICKSLRSLGIYSKELIPPAYVAWRPGTTNPIPTRFLAPIDCYKIPALHTERSSSLLFNV
jgi:hypothetical protein